MAEDETPAEPASLEDLTLAVAEMQDRIEKLESQLKHLNLVSGRGAR